MIASTAPVARKLIILWSLVQVQHGLPRLHAGYLLDGGACCCSGWPRASSCAAIQDEGPRIESPRERVLCEEGPLPDTSPAAMRNCIARLEPKTTGCDRVAALTLGDIDSRQLRGETQMGFHPANLAIRFLLELSALAAMGVWGWQQGDDPGRYAFALLVPLVAATAWGVFAVPGDRSRSGKAPVAVPGAVRLGVEVAFFAFAIFALYQSGSKAFSAVFAATASVHYVASYDRVASLLRA